MPRGRHHPGDPSRRWTLASCRRMRRLGPAAPRCPLGHDPQAAFEPGRAQTAPELGAVPAPGGPFPLKARQPRLETALADAEHVLALAADDLAHELAAQPRQANDPLEGDTISGHLADHPVGVLAAQETLVSQALGGSQNLRIELLRPDRLADIGQRVPNGGKEGRSGVLQQMPPVGDLHRVWQGPRYGAAVPAVPIAGDDLDLGMPAQPGFDGRGLAIRQEVDDTAPLEVADQRAVALAPSPRPVIDTDHAALRRRNRWTRPGRRAGKCLCSPAAIGGPRGLAPGVRPTPGRGGAPAPATARSAGHAGA